MLKPLEYLYFAIAATEVYAEATNNVTLRFFSKPLLMVVLIWFYLSQANDSKSQFHRLMIWAFAFSWVGDVALMFVGEKGTSLMGIPQHPDFFLVGLVGFLITHILYTIVFAKVDLPSVKPILKSKPWLLLPLLAYMAILISQLVPAIYGVELTKPFLAPVLVYSTAIATMVVFALNRYGRVDDSSFALVFAGAILFMISDSIIAINKFIVPFDFARIAIMVLYISGQYLISKGCLKQQQVAG